MSNYQDIYRDLPSRVYEVWQRTKRVQEKESEDRSVTAMLMAAAAGLAMPWENLKTEGLDKKEKWRDHPAFNHVDQSKYKSALKSCNSFLKQPINGCHGLQNAVLMPCQELRNIRDAAKCGHGDASLDISKHDVRFALKIMRNALSHNNIFDIPDSQDRIEKLVFFSENRTGSGCKSTVDGWHVLTISVKSFEDFLNAWFDLLKGQDSFIGAAMALAGEDNNLPD